MRVVLMNNKQGFFYGLKKHKALYILMLPGLLLILINNYIPMLGTIIAFKRITYGNNIFETYIKSPFNGFKNFEFFLKTSYAWIITRNTVLFNLAFIVIGLILAVSAAICLNELLSKRLFKFYQSVMILPNFLSWVIVSLIVYSFIADKGFINSVLPSFGLKEPIQFYNETKYWPFIIIATQAWYYLGTSAVIYLAAITGINTELFESAKMDGASKWQQIWAITLPMLKSTMIFMVMVSLGNLFVGNFGLFYNVPRESGLLFDVTNVIDTYVFRALNQTGDIEMAAAASFYQSIVGFVIVMVSNTLLRITNKENAVF
jgi:putative aldouronate transport system permease protein